MEEEEEEEVGGGDGKVAVVAAVVVQGTVAHLSLSRPSKLAYFGTDAGFWITTFFLLTRFYASCGRMRSFPKNIEDYSNKEGHLAP